MISLRSYCRYSVYNIIVLGKNGRGIEYVTSLDQIMFGASCWDIKFLALEG
jgi:hypothetical protein